MSGRTRPLGDELPLTGRLLAIDLGEVRVGLAVSDPGQVVASPAETLQVPRDADRPALDALVTACARHEAAALVVGLPRKLDGSEDAPARRARWFADQLRERTGLPVRLHDERFTTVEAERVLLQGDVSRAGRKSHIDQVAASVLLQGVLESQRTRRAPAGAAQTGPASTRDLAADGDLASDGDPPSDGEPAPAPDRALASDGDPAPDRDRGPDPAPDADRA